MMGTWFLLRALTIPPSTNDHAVQRHGWSAVCAHAWCKETPDLERYTWDCGDRLKFIVPMDTPNTWAVTLVTSDLSRVISSFTSHDLGAVLKSVGRECTHSATGVSLDNLLHAW